MENLKLYIWEDVLTDYTPGVMFALAPDVETARKMLLEDTSYIPDEDLSQEPKVYTSPVAVVVWGGG